MKNSDIFVFVAVLIFVAFSFYRKYIKKDNLKINSQTKEKSLYKREKFAGTKDDYEPYSGKENNKAV